MQFALLNDTPQWNVKNNELNWRFCNCSTQSQSQTAQAKRPRIIIIIISLFLLK